MTRALLSSSFLVALLACDRPPEARDPHPPGTVSAEPSTPAPPPTHESTVPPPPDPPAPAAPPTASASATVAVPTASASSAQVPGRTCATCTKDEFCFMASGGAVQADGGYRDIVSCTALPATCRATPTCDCLAKTVAFTTCEKKQGMLRAYALQPTSRQR